MISLTKRTDQMNTRLLICIVLFICYLQTVTSWATLSKYENDAPLDSEFYPKSILETTPKRDWNRNLHSWGKRAWQKLQTGWGKRDTLLDRSPLDDKRAWSNLKSGNWGKRDLTDLIADNIPDDQEQYENDGGKEESQFQGNSQDKRAWKSTLPAWGKRSKWSNLNAAWGKRDPAWTNLKGIWGKRNLSTDETEK